MAIQHTVSFSGQTMTLAELREFVDNAEDSGIGGDQNVKVAVDPRTNNPTDPGGTISMQVTG